MDQHFINNHQDYLLGALDESSVKANPLEQFDVWFCEASEKGIMFPEAMILATADAKGTPSARVLLLKSYDDRGFEFYSNYESRKGKELEKNPNASLLFFWAVFQRQIRIEGKVAKLPIKESERYFATRPRESQIGAWASRQSEPLESSVTLERLVARFAEKFKNKLIPRPPYWGGYVLKPRRFEFWQGRANRLHDRIVYIKKGSHWAISRLSP